MKRTNVRKAMIAGALVLGLAGAGLASRAQSAPSPILADSAPATLSPFELAKLLSVGPSDTVIIALDSPRHELPGALPVAVFGESDDHLLKNAPKRRVVLVGSDAVRTDRLARQLSAAGRDVTVLQGGIQAWDQAMDVDPAPPEPHQGAEAWEKHRMNVALRRRFGEKDESQPAPAVAAPPVPVLAAPAAPKKREGC